MLGLAPDSAKASRCPCSEKSSKRKGELRRQQLPTANCLLPSAYCLLFFAVLAAWGGGRVAEAQPRAGEASQAQAKPDVKPAPPVKGNTQSVGTEPGEKAKREKREKAGGSRTAPTSATPGEKQVAKTPPPDQRSQSAVTEAKPAKKKVASRLAGGTPALPAKHQRAPAVAGRRDPFRLPPPPAPPGQAEPLRATGPLPPGKRGLIIGQLRLEGTVRKDSTQTMIAVVANSNNRAYFLRERDAVYDGVVSKITPDAVYFQENITDMNGRVSSHEVVKRLGPAPGGPK